jgi:iron complex outermembrane recepter protein
MNKHMNSKPSATGRARRFAFLVAACIASGAACYTSHADEALQEITVTAARRETALQGTPVAVSAITSEQIEVQRVESISDVQLLVPGLTFTSLTHAESYVSIRGTGIKNDAPGTDLGVSVFIDDVPTTGIADNDPDLFDLQDIEVLRGPQGTLFGRNVTGGAVLIHTALPSFTPKEKLEVTYGDHDLIQARALVSGPLLDNTLAGKVTVSMTKQDGNVANLTTHHADNAIDLASLRAQLRWTPTDDFQALLSGDITRDTSNSRTIRLFGTFQPTLWPTLHYGPDVTDQVSDPRGDKLIHGLSAKVDWTLPFATLTSISGYRNVQTSIDWETTGDPLSQLGSNQSERDHQVTEEIHLASPVEDRRLTWIAGLFFLHSDRANYHPLYFHYVVPGTFLSTVSPTWATPNTLTNSQEVQTRSVAAFASVTYAIADPLKLTVGIRESNERKSGHSLLSDAAGTTPYLDAHYSHTWSSFTPQANLAYQPTKDLLTYATVATGFKSGGYDINASTIAGLKTPFNPEKVTSYEVGAKDSAFHHRLQLDLALYRAYYHDLQVTSFNPIAVDYVTSNAASSLIQGVEFEGVAKPLDSLTAGVSYDYTDAKYRNYQSANASGPPAVYSGNRIPYVARDQWHLFADVEAPLGSGRGVITLGADVTYRSAIEFDDANSVSRLLVNQTKYRGVTNAHVSWESATKGTTVSLWAKNLTDRRAIVDRSDFLVFYATPAEFNDPNNVLSSVTYTPARSYGVSVTVTY